MELDCVHVYPHMIVTSNKSSVVEISDTIILINVAILTFIMCDFEMLYVQYKYYLLILLI